MISALAGTQPIPVQTVDKQSVQDIMRRMKVRHAVTSADYDKIYQYFLGGSIRTVCNRLWEFCRSEMKYVEESVKIQNLSCPYTILTGGRVDCKNYALFCGGVLDAMKRAGKSLDWCYRFACYEFDLFNMDPGHVFVVVNQNTDNIWLDPVLGEFDYHLFYWKKSDQRVSTEGKAVAGIAKIGSAESDLLASVKEYADGINGAIITANKNGALNQIALGVLNSASAAVPGLSQVMSLIHSGQVLLNNTFGPGSIEARLFSDLGGNIFTILPNVINDIFNGRTYNTDQYWAAVYYQNKVLGRGNITNINQVSDADVIPALKWFIDRLGVFISGREHIIALTQSPQAYVSYYKVNADTTTDMSRVTAAYNVARNWDLNGAPGSWANTIGVYDPLLVALAKASGLSVEQVAAANNYKNVYSSAANPGQSTSTLAWVAVAALIFGSLVIK